MPHLLNKTQQRANGTCQRCSVDAPVTRGDVSGLPVALCAPCLKEFESDTKPKLMALVSAPVSMTPGTVSVAGGPVADA